MAAVPNDIGSVLLALPAPHACVWCQEETQGMRARADLIGEQEDREEQEKTNENGFGRVFFFLANLFLSVS